MIRIANGQGFWGDSLDAPVRLIEQGPIDYLILDYLAEVTMSILQKQKDSDPELAYLRDRYRAHCQEAFASSVSFKDPARGPRLQQEHDRLAKKLKQLEAEYFEREQ